MAGMNVGTLVLAVVLALVGLLLWWWRHRIGGELAIMAATPTSKAADVARMAPGALVEVKGALRCDAPLVSEFTQKPCAYFKSEITREETYFERDSDGKSQTRTRTVTIHSSMQHALCAMQDDSGKVAINMADANVAAVSVLDHRGNPNAAPASGQMAKVAQWADNDRYMESILAPDIAAYVLGEVLPGGVIGKPVKSSHNKIFVVSAKSKEQRTKDLGSTMKWVLWGVILLFVLAAIALWAAIAIGPG